MKIKRWNEATIDTAEDFKALRAIRIGGVGYAKGADVTLTGEQKKKFYLSKDVCYPEDYENVLAALLANEPVIIPLSNEPTDPNYRSGVELVGTKDGSNKTFTFPDNDLCVAESEEIHINANTLLRNIGYTVTDTTVTLAAVTPAPESDEYIWANYKKL